MGIFVSKNEGVRAEMVGCKGKRGGPPGREEGKEMGHRVGNKDGPEERAAQGKGFLLTFFCSYFKTF
jgi:hypothetical protein